MENLGGWASHYAHLASQYARADANRGHVGFAATCRLDFMQLCRAAAPPYRSLATLAVVAAAVAATSSCVRPSLPSRSALSSTPPAAADLDRRLTADVRPLLETYCTSCHGGSSPMAKLDLTAFDTTAKVVAAFDVWERLHGRIDRREMPPRGMPQPTDAERRMISEWFSAVQEREAERHAGDPGVVLARRLNNAEFNYTIHDLTGVDIAPTRTSRSIPPTRPGSTIPAKRSPCRRRCWQVPRCRSQRRRSHRLSAARVHVRATRGGDGPDRDRYVVNRIMEFYRRQRPDLADYFLALWRYENRSALGLKGATLASIAAKERLSAAVPGTAAAAAAGPHGRVRSGGGPAGAMGRDAGGADTSG